MSNITTINANAEVFVVPNKAALAEEFWFGKETKEDLVRSICEANNQTYDSKHDKLIQLWLTSKDDLHSDNLVDHDFYVTINDIDMYARLPYHFSNLPKQLLPSEEGSTRTLVIPGCIASPSYKYRKAHPEAVDEEVEFTLVLNLTAAQEKYRYRNFGKFENVVNTVLF